MFRVNPREGAREEASGGSKEHSEDVVVSRCRGIGPPSGIPSSGLCLY